MSKAIIFAMLLCTGASFANENPTIVTSPCTQFDSQKLCQNYSAGECAWDAATKLCSQGRQISHHQPVCRYMTYRVCLRHPHCYWNYGSCHRN